MIELTVYLTIGEGCYLKLRGKKIYFSPVPDMPPGEEQWWIESDRRGYAGRVPMRGIEKCMVDRVEQNGFQWYIGKFLPGEGIDEVRARLPPGDAIYID